MLCNGLRKSVLPVAALLCFLAASSSYASNKPPKLLSQTKNGIVVDETFAWANPDLPICFGNSTTRISSHSSLHVDLSRRAKRVYDNSPLEARIRQVVNREFTPSTTGIHFTGWKSCNGITNDTPDAPAFIFADTELPDFGITTVGDDRIGTKIDSRNGLRSGAIFNLRKIDQYSDYSTLRAAKALIKVSGSDRTAEEIGTLSKKIDRVLRNKIIDTTILHEIGHLTGLGHEERRKDAAANQPTWCRSSDDLGAQGRDEKTYGTEFDPFSVMNYCSDDVAIGYSLYHLLCQFPKEAQALENAKPDFGWHSVAPFCSFMMGESYPARLTARDKAGLKRLYLGTPIPSGSRSIRTNPRELEALRALNALYENLPETMGWGSSQSKSLK